MYRNHFISVTIMLFIGLSAFGQKLSRVDSMKLKLVTAGDDDRRELLYQIAFDLFDTDKVQAFQYAELSYKEALKSGDTTSIIFSGTLYGQLLRRMDRPSEAIDQLLYLEPIARRHNHPKLKIILNSLAVAYTYQANYDKALDYNLQSLEIREREGNKNELSVTLHNIGLVYYKLGQNQLAIEYYQRAIKAKTESGDQSNLARMYFNTGLSFNDLKEYSKAQDYFDLGFKVCDNCDEETLMEGELGMGTSLKEQKKFEAALPYLEKALKSSISQNNLRYQLYCLNHLAEIHLERKDFQTARKYLEEADAIPVIGDYKDVHKTIYQVWAQYYRLTNDFEKAWDYEHRYSQLNDSILNNEVVQNLAKVQTRYAERENLAIIADSNRLLQLQKQFSFLLVAVITLITALVIVIYRNYQTVRRVNSDLAAAKLMIEEQNHALDNQVREKTKELVDTNINLQKVNDELDNFIYKTSHDIRGPLASLKGMVNLAMLDVKDDKALGYLSKLDLTAEKLNAVLTRLLIVNKINHTELRPEPIHFEPIIQDILSLEMKKGVPTKIRVDYEVEGGLTIQSDQEMLRLILENLIDNAIKFYNESERIESFVRISVRKDANQVIASVVDNGVGIAAKNRDKIFQMFVRASERSETGGIGLYLAKLATEKLHGEISLNQTEEGYTQFIVRLPQDLAPFIGKKQPEYENQPTQAIPVGGAA